jgi:uncharacterized MAPEG superfamily protein
LAPWRFFLHRGISFAGVSIERAVVRLQGMTISLWTLLAALLLPYILTGVAAGQRKEEFGALDNHLPRVQQSKATGRDARAHGAMHNAWEALIVYAPCVLFAHFAAPESTLAPKLSIAWLGLRLLHPFFYIADIPLGRTLSFALAAFSALALFLVGGHIL